MCAPLLGHDERRPLWATGHAACGGLFCFRGADDGSDVAGRLAFVDHELGYVEVMSRG